MIKGFGERVADTKEKTSVISGIASYAGRTGDALSERVFKEDCVVYDIFTYVHMVGT